MELVSETLFLMILLNSAIGDIQHANFVNDISKTNQVFGDSLFNITTPSLLKCVAKCNVVKECLAVSITMYGVDCRGYQRFSDPSPYLGVKVWKKEPRCPANFTYTTTLDLCWRWYSQKATWTEAKSLCLEEDGRLVVFNSKEKFDFIRDDIRGTGNSDYYWIGGTFVANMWKWLDGTAVNMTTTFWGPGEPNGRHLPADCIGWNLFTHGKFDDGLCSLPDRNRYICEIP